MPSACASPRSAFEARFPLVGSFPEVLYPHLIRFGQANISCDKMHVFLRRDESRVRLLREIPYTRAVEMGAGTLFSSNDEESYRELLDPTRLIERYRAGRRWSVGRFRMIVGESTVMNVRVAVCVGKPDKDEGYIASIYVNACEARSSWERNLRYLLFATTISSCIHRGMPSFSLIR